MLSSLVSWVIPRPVCRFFKRHKRKFIFGTTVVGGGYAAWKFIAPRLQDRLIRRLMNELAKGSDQDAAEAAERRQRQNFEHKQGVSDSHARRKFVTLRAKHNESFQVETRMASLSKVPKQEKLKAFKAMLIECLAKTVSALYMAHFLLLLHRVGFNVVGREVQQRLDAADKDSQAREKVTSGDEQLADSDGKSAPGVDEAVESHKLFLQLLDHFQDGCMDEISSVVRRIVGNCYDRANFEPNGGVTVDALEKFFTDCCKEVGSDLFGRSRGAALIFPDSLHSNIAAPHRDNVKLLLDEARDHVDSPHFNSVLQTAVEEGAGVVCAELGEQATASGAGAEGLLPLAKYSGLLTKLAGAMWEDDGAGEGLGASLVQKFSQHPRVEELCRGLFYATA